MITLIRGALLRLFFYWKKPVTGRHGRCCQNDNFIGVARTQDEFFLSSESVENWFQAKISRYTNYYHSTEFTQIPIVFRRTVTPCRRPAVSSIGACPTPAR